MNDLVSIRPFRLEDDAELRVNAEKDGHSVWFPNWVLVKKVNEKDTIVGYLSINMLPLVLSWQSTEYMGPSDSLEEIGFIKGALCGCKNFCIPCDPESPYMKFLPKAGFIPYTKPVHLFLKGD